jgi:23S rRNA pseudouridine2605 synthase
MPPPKNRPPRRGLPRSAAAGTVTIARGLSKLGLCSRTEGERLVLAGRVRINGTAVRDLALRIVPERDTIEIDGARVGEVGRIYLALNKPRGLVTTRDDPQGRQTIYECFAGAQLPFVAPVGRLDRASEGLLLLTNDTRWSAHLLDPASHVDKLYRVQVRGLEHQATIARAAAGVVDPETGERLSAKRIALLRTGTRSSAWLEITLDEGKNRHIRRLMSALGVEVLRLMRVAIGPLQLGALPKGQWRPLTDEEVRALGPLRQR